MEKKVLLQNGRELSTSTADWGLFYSVLVLLCLYIYVFNHPPLPFFFIFYFFPPSWGWGIKAEGGSYP